MERQVLIDHIESICRDIESLSQFTNMIEIFIKKPASKKQIQDFSEKYILNVFVDPIDLTAFYAKLTVDSSSLNTCFLRELITDSKVHKGKDLSLNLMGRMKTLFNGVYELLRENEAALIEKNFPDMAERLMALRRAVCKINLIFCASRQLPIEVEQFPELTLNSANEIYLYKDLNECIKHVSECILEQFEYFNNWAILSTAETSALTYPIIDQNNWVSLRNFILYLDSFLEY